jgi:CRP-like cAMP-binding protein
VYGAAAVQIASMLADRSPPAQARVASASTVTPALAAALMAGPSHRNQEQLFDVQSWLQHKSSLGEPLLQHLKAKTLAALARASLDPLTLTPFEMGMCDVEFRSTVCKLRLNNNVRFSRDVLVCFWLQTVCLQGSHSTCAYLLVSGHLSIWHRNADDVAPLQSLPTRTPPPVPPSVWNNTSVPEPALPQTANLGARVPALGECVGFVHSAGADLQRMAIGEVALLQGEARTVSLRAESADTLLLCIDAATFDSLVRVCCAKVLRASRA